VAAHAIGDLPYLRISQERTPDPARSPDQPDRQDNYLTAGATKNGKARMVVMTAEVLALVTALIQDKQLDDFVFTHDDGTPVKDFRGSWAKMFADAGVEMRKLHDMRRSAVRNAIRRGWTETR